jgi:hypothetical protein
LAHLEPSAGTDEEYSSTELFWTTGVARRYNGIRLLKFISQQLTNRASSTRDFPQGPDSVAVVARRACRFITGYTIGKVVVDHGPIEPIVDKQLGRAGLIMTMMKLDPSITFDDKIADAEPTPILDATWLQTSLNTLGATPPLVIDGIFGAATRTAVRAFQKSKDGLTANGVANADTVSAIKEAIAKIQAGSA